jgi:hypothetical protein
LRFFGRRLIATADGWQRLLRDITHPGTARVPKLLINKGMAFGRPGAFKKAIRGRQSLCFDSIR